MAKNKHEYYMPQGDFEFYEWALNFLNEAETYAASWNLPTAKLATLRAELTAYKGYLDQAYSEMATSADIRQKNTAHRDLAHHFQDFVNQHVRYNPNITPDQMANLGGPVKDPIKTPIGPYPTAPVLGVWPLTSHEHRLDFHELGSAKRAIPYGQDGAVLYTLYQDVSEAIPTDPVVFKEGDSELMSASPYIKEHPAAMQGKRVCFAARWQNGKGEKSTFSEIVTAIVP